jgi:hypothetical protein
MNEELASWRALVHALVVGKVSFAEAVRVAEKRPRKCKN